MRQDSPRQDDWTRKDAFFGRLGVHGRRHEAEADGHIQTEDAPERHQVSCRCSRPLACEGLDGRERNEGVTAEGLAQEARCITEETDPPRLRHVPNARH